jgi:hypothetical protein
MPQLQRSSKPFVWPSIRARRKHPLVAHGHIFCSVHPTRVVPRDGFRCWLCEKKDDDFVHLDRLIGLGLGDTPQLHITGELERAAASRLVHQMELAL